MTRPFPQEITWFRMKHEVYRGSNFTIRRIKSDINQAPPMSNRKLRHDLELLKQEIAQLREELKNRPAVIIREFPQNPPLPTPYVTPQRPSFTPQQPFFIPQRPSVAPQFGDFPLPQIMCGAQCDSRR